MAELTPIQKHILEHCRNRTYDPSKSVDANVSLFNMRCFVGMIETGEAEWEDIRRVGGDPLVAAVAKLKGAA